MDKATKIKYYIYIKPYTDFIKDSLKNPLLKMYYKHHIKMHFALLKAFIIIDF